MLKPKLLLLCEPLYGGCLLDEGLSIYKMESIADNMFGVDHALCTLNTSRTFWEKTVGALESMVLTIVDNMFGVDDALCTLNTSRTFWEKTVGAL
jgi:hypothetical protein